MAEKDEKSELQQRIESTMADLKASGVPEQALTSFKERVNQLGTESETEKGRLAQQELFSNIIAGLGDIAAGVVGKKKGLAIGPLDVKQPDFASKRAALGQERQQRLADLVTGYEAEKEAARDRRDPKLLELKELQRQAGIKAEKDAAVLKANAKFKEDEKTRISRENIAAANRVNLRTVTDKKIEADKEKMAQKVKMAEGKLQNKIKLQDMKAIGKIDLEHLKQSGRISLTDAKHLNARDLVELKQLGDEKIVDMKLAAVGTGTPENKLNFAIYKFHKQRGDSAIESAKKAEQWVKSFGLKEGSLKLSYEKFLHEQGVDKNKAEVAAEKFKTIQNLNERKFSLQQAAVNFKQKKYDDSKYEKGAKLLSSKFTDKNYLSVRPDLTLGFNEAALALGISPKVYIPDQQKLLETTAKVLRGGYGDTADYKKALVDKLSEYRAGSVDRIKDIKNKIQVIESEGVSPNDRVEAAIQNAMDKYGLDRETAVAELRKQDII